MMTVGYETSLFGLSACAGYTAKVLYLTFSKRASNGGEASSTARSDVDVEEIHRELQSVLAALQAVDDAL